MRASSVLVVACAVIAGAQPHLGHGHMHKHAAKRSDEIEQKRAEVIEAPELEVRDPKKKKHHYGGGGYGGGSNYGLAYDPTHPNDGTYKNVAEITADFQKFKAAGYSHIRTYRTDFDQVGHMLTACQKTGIKLFPGTSTITDVDTEIAAIISAGKGRWHLVDSVGVGNELVNSGQADAASVCAATSKARGLLRGAGYKGPVVSPDTFVAYYDNPSLCEAGDYVAANCHAYFDGGVTAAGAANFVKTQHANVVSHCGGKHVRITESGWPSAGGANGAAIPSKANQVTVVNALKQAFAGQDITLFMAYNEPYKQYGSSAATNGAEPYWGIMS